MNKITLSFAAIFAMVFVGAGCGQKPVVQQTGSSAPPSLEGSLQEAAYVRIGPEGFSPKSIEIKKGETVTWLNEDSAAAHWPASAPHPTHTDYPEFDSKAGIKPGESWSFKFDRVGIWKYHDHVNPTLFGSVTVKE